MFLLVFDIPKSRESLKRKINRMLHEANATLIQKSVWKSEKIETLKRIAEELRKEGARATVLEEKILF